MRSSVFVLLSVFAFSMLPGVAAAAPFPYILLEDTTEPGEEYSLYYELAPTHAWSRQGGARIAFDFGDQDNLRYATYSFGRLAVVEVTGGKSQDLAATTDFRPKGSVKTTIQRRADRVVVVADAAVMLTVPLPAPAGGQVGAGSRDGRVRCLQGILQPVGPIYWTDDFTRGAQAMADWETVSGVWENTEVKAPGANPEQSANPFSLRCAAPAGGLATAGQWFWDVYGAQVSVKPIQAQAIGLCAYLHGPADYLLFRWEAGEPGAAKAKQLVLVQNGRERVLAEAPGGFDEGQWYRLAVELGHGVAVCKIDRDLVLRAETKAFGQGAVGLWAQGEAVSFDDVEVMTPGLRLRKLHVNETFLADSVLNAEGVYTAQGQWRVGHDGTCWHRGVFFSDFSVRVPGQLARAGALTLFLRAAEPDPKTGYAVALHPEGDQMKVEVRRGDVTVGQGSGQLSDEGYLEAAWRQGRLSVWLDGAEAVAVQEDRPASGRRIAVAGAGLGAFPASRPGAPIIIEWGGLGGPQLGPFVGGTARPEPNPDDLGIQLEGLQPFLQLNAGQTLNLNTARGMPGPWIGLQADGDPLTAIKKRWVLPDGGEIEFEVRGKQAAQAEDAARQAEEAERRRKAVQMLRELKGNVIILDGDVAVPEAPAGLPGDLVLRRRGGFGGRVSPRVSSGTALSLIEVTGANCLDYTFADAPTDWYATKGDWHVTTRWPCQPGWTFFGGVHYENPVAWTKHSYEGDIVFEVRTNIQMDLPRSPGYSDPSDLDLALCGDGVNLDSGYAFIYAGWGNTKSAILRKGKIVAENASAVFVEPTSGNSAFHRHWFRLRAEKIGNRIRFLCDDKLVCEYADPDPLPGGRVAMWSAGNNLMVARAQLWYESERSAPVPRLPDPPPAREPTERRAGPAIVDSFERDMGEWHTLIKPISVRLELDDGTAARGKRSLRITNLRPGGPMVSYALQEGFRASQWRHLSFAYRIPPEVRVDVYLYLGDAWHVIHLTGNTPPGADMRVLGKFQNVQADDRWHHAEFDLLTPLKNLYPQRQVFPVDYVAFASPDERYLRCGIGGNPMGATYWIDEFRLGP